MNETIQEIMRRNEYFSPSTYTAKFFKGYAPQYYFKFNRNEPDEIVRLREMVFSEPRYIPTRTVSKL